MKKIVLSLLLVFSFFSFIDLVKAETFFEGEFLSGEYLKKKIDNKYHYLTLQYIKDSKGNIVYCLEPYVMFEEGKIYTDTDISDYNDLPWDLKHRISLIVYFGYGYHERLESKWYAVTQYLIWNSIMGDNVYFTDRLNGKKIVKYKEEINEILEDINAYEELPPFPLDYTINLGEDLVINGLEMYNVFNCPYVGCNSGYITNVLNTDQIHFGKYSNYYEDRLTIYDSGESQDLIKPGNIDTKEYIINVEVKKGNIVLDVKKDDSVYTAESDLKDTCYQIVRGEEVVDSLCTGSDEIVYQSVDLPFGDYEVRQVSSGIGYRKSNEVFRVNLNDNNQKETITLYNYLLRNKIEINKYACKNEVCGFEENAVFKVYDKNNKLAGEIVTDKLGYGELELGYGTYKVKQDKGIDDYTLVADYKERIVDEETSHLKKLFNNYIEKEVERKLEEPKIEEVEEPVVVEPVLEEVSVTLPPDTKTDDNVLFLILLISSIILLKVRK